MKLLSICLLSLSWLMPLGLSADEQGFPPLSILASDPAEQSVVVLDSDRSIKTLRFGESLSGEDWRAELIHVAADGARFEWVRVSGEPRNRLEVWIGLRAGGEKRSEIRVLSPEVQAPNESGIGYQPPKIPPEIPDGARVYEVSPSRGSIEVTASSDHEEGESDQRP